MEQKNVEWGAWGAGGVWKKKFNTKDQVGNKENNKGKGASQLR